MSWDVKVNNTSLKTAYGGTLLRGSFDGLLTWPSIKAIDYNDWAEESGIEPDLSEMHFNARQASFNIHFPTYSQLVSFLAAIEAESVQTWSFPFLGSASTGLRMTNAAIDYGPKFSVLGLTLMEDEFDCLGTGATGDMSVGSNAEYMVDGVALTRFGVRVIGDPYGSLLSPGAVKQHLTRTNKLMDGNDYAKTITTSTGTATYPHVFGSHVFSVPCLMTGSLTNVVTNSFSLFKFLTRINENKTLMKRLQRNVYLNGKSADCYYQSMEITSLYLDESRTWMEYNINFVTI